MFRRLLRLFGSNRDARPKQRSSSIPPIGSFDHYSDAVETFKQLKREKRHEEAESLLLWCIEQTEREPYDNPAPWYYKHLAIVYRKDNRYDDGVQIIERYLNRASSPRDDFPDRLRRAKELAEKSAE